MSWNLEQLRQFVATAERGSISAAARHLGKAQSAVSTAISLLEADLGLELFDRTQHRATLSDAGQLMLLEAKELLRQAHALDQRAHSLVVSGEAKLTLALDEALPYTAIKVLTREISERFFDLELTLLNGTATEVSDYVSQGRADVAFQLDRGELRDCFDQRHIGLLPQAVFVSAGHPLARLQSVTRTDLAQYRQLVMCAEEVGEVIVSPKVWRSDSFYTIAEMIQDNLGWAVLPAYIAADGYSRSLRQVNCSSLALPLLSVRMLWLQGRPLSGIAHWVERRLAELLEKLQ